MCFSCICLFVLYVLVFVIWCRGLAAVCDCGTLWTFLLTFFLSHFPVFFFLGTASVTPTNHSHAKPLSIPILVNYFL